MAWRSALGLTLVVVAERAGVQQPMLSKIECGHSGVRFRTLEAIVTRGLKISLSRFFGPTPRARKLSRAGRPRTIGVDTGGARAS